MRCKKVFFTVSPATPILYRDLESVLAGNVKDMSSPQLVQFHQCGNLRENRPHAVRSARRDKRLPFERSEIHAFGLQSPAERLGHFPLRVQRDGQGDERRSVSHRHQGRKPPPDVKLKSKMGSPEYTRV